MVNKIQELRTEKNISKHELAEMIKISVDYLSRIERGKREPSLKLAVRIAKALDSTLDELFFY